MITFRDEVGCSSITLNLAFGIKKENLCTYKITIPWLITQNCFARFYVINMIGNKQTE